MKTTAVTQRLSGLGGAKWEIHLKAKELINQGRDIVSLTIGEPDVPTPDALMQIAMQSMLKGRTGYSDGRGEKGLRLALAERASKRTGQSISADQIMCFPGTQTALYAVLMGVAETGDEVLVGDPMYATYEGVVRASGANMVPVPLHAGNGFRMTANDVAKAITPHTTALLLTTPHNPTGAILSEPDIREIGQLALQHDLWIISDEVYEDLVFSDTTFTSALVIPEIADRVIVVSSISKSHAAPGFRSGWCIGPKDFTSQLLPLSETMLFGNQPFIADMTEAAVRNGSPVAAEMRRRFAARAEVLEGRLSTDPKLSVHRPEAGMFALINVTGTGMNGDQYAAHLLEHGGVAVMPGSSFGLTMNDWVRVALTVDDTSFNTACDRILAHAAALSLEIA